MSKTLHYELEAMGVKMKIIQPGMIATDFAGRRFDFANDSRITEYQTVISKFMTFSMKSEMEPSPPKLAASII